MQHDAESRCIDQISVHALGTQIHPTGIQRLESTDWNPPTGIHRLESTDCNPPTAIHRLQSTDDNSESREFALTHGLQQQSARFPWRKAAAR
jgi:hypothetical protein